MQKEYTLYSQHCTEPDPAAHVKDKGFFLNSEDEWKVKSTYFIAEQISTKKNNKIIVKFCDASLTFPIWHM